MLYDKKVHINFSCVEDLNQILKDVSKVSVTLPNKILKEFYSKISNLEKFPKMYQVIKIINQIEVRKIVIEKYIVVYFISGKNIYIVNMFPQKVNYYNLIKS